MFIRGFGMPGQGTGSGMGSGTGQQQQGMQGPSTGNPVPGQVAYPGLTRYYWLESNSNLIYNE